MRLILLLRLCFVTLTNGTNANVSAIPVSRPAINPVKFCCSGSVPNPNRVQPRISNLIIAMCGFFKLFQWHSTSCNISDASTPAIEGSGPTSAL
uniref:Putative secreted protein n=1 Tax=Anopheles darlingi TaxID=43151 RepID=A0A2M4D9X6_ANODA